MRDPDDTTPYMGGLRTSDHPQSALPRITPSGFADIVTVTAAQQSRNRTGFPRPHRGHTMQTHGRISGTSIPCRTAPDKTISRISRKILLIPSPRS